MDTEMDGKVWRAINKDGSETAINTVLDHYHW